MISMFCYIVTKCVDIHITFQRHDYCREISDEIIVYSLKHNATKSKKRSTFSCTAIIPSDKIVNALYFYSVQINDAIESYHDL